MELLYFRDDLINQRKFRLHRNRLLIKEFMVYSMHQMNNYQLKKYSWNYCILDNYKKTKVLNFISKIFQLKK